MKPKSTSMLEGPILPNIIRYTIPIILTSLLQVFYNAADLAIVGQFCGSLSVAAVGSTGSITNLIINLFVGFSVGSGVAVAHGIGCNNKETVHRTVHTALPTALVSGLVLTTLGLLLSRTFLQMMDSPTNIIDMSTLYMRIYFCGTIFSMVYNFCASILRAAGDTKSPLIFLFISGLINVGLNIIFVTVLNMNVAGVALATIISQAVSAILVVRALMKRDDACKLVLKDLRFYKHELLRIIRIGLPAGVQGSLFAISNVVIQSSINSFGDVFVSGSAAASNLEGFVFVCLNAFHQTAVNFVGQNTGAKQHQRVRKIYWTCLGCVAVIGIILGCSVRIFGKQLLGIYITDSDLAITYGLIRITYTCIPYFLCGMMDVTTGALRGLGSSVPPMIISIIGVCGIRLLWVYTIFQIPSLHSPECLFFSYTVSWLTSFMIQLVVFLSLHNKIIRAQTADI